MSAACHSRLVRNGCPVGSSGLAMSGRDVARHRDLRRAAAALRSRAEPRRYHDASGSAFRFSRQRVTMLSSLGRRSPSDGIMPLRAQGLRTAIASRTCP